MQTTVENRNRIRHSLTETSEKILSLESFSSPQETLEVSSWKSPDKTVELWLMRAWEKRRRIFGEFLEKFPKTLDETAGNVRSAG